MVELRIQPVVCPVATVTRSGESGGQVVRIGGLLEVGCMARVTLRRHCDELAVGHAFMAGIAVHGRVRSGQRKAIVVLLDLLDRDLPSADRVALLAVRAQLPLVNVGVAILAALSNVSENRPDVTFSATHRLMHAAQRIFCLVVIEFRNSSDRFPCARRVAVLTRNAQVAVWTMRSSGNLRTGIPCSCRNCEDRNGD